MGSRYRGSKSEARALSAVINLVRAGESVMGRLNGQFAGLAITQSQFSVLDAIFHLGPLSQRELGEKIFRTSGNVTMVVDNLERGGMVRRERDLGDRRRVAVRLTAKGKNTIRELLPRRVAAIRDEMAALSAAEQDELRRLCRKLGRQGG
ncbi:MAG: MarR family transcriptional regulator [Nitrospinota bacterium]|nr:MarR family transcriptional regulator [Nitrospinota bacterium]